MEKKYDLLIVGAGIVGMAHAYEARQRGLSVLVVEQNDRCVGASIRNFGFITVSGQRAGDTWRRAAYSAQVWKNLTQLASIKVLHQSTWILCERPEAAEVAKAFLKTEMGKDCQYVAKADYSKLDQFEVNPASGLNLENSVGLLYSPHEFRVESREAIPQLAQYLEEKRGVDFCWNTAVLSIEGAEIKTSQGHYLADKVVICPGASLTGIAKPYLHNRPLKLCTLQMLRVKVDEGYRLPGSVMTDNSLARYLGWADLPEATALKERIAKEMPEYLQEGIHLIVVQSEDGTLVVGDSHRYGAYEAVFASEQTDQLILDLLRRVLNIKALNVVERWTGVYPSADAYDAFIEKVSPRLRVAVVSSGTGASTAFGLAKDNFDDWLTT